MTTLDPRRKGVRLKIRDLHRPITNAKKISQLLRLKFPKLNAELVLCSTFGQTPVDASPWQYIEKIPSIFVETKTRRELLALFDTITALKDRNDHAKSDFIREQINVFRARVSSLLEEIELMESGTIELRLVELDYDLIAQLQRDQLVCSALTPQSRSSIRIVLGTLRSLSDWKPVKKTPSPAQNDTFNPNEQTYG